MKDFITLGQSRSDSFFASEAVNGANISVFVQSFRDTSQKSGVEVGAVLLDGALVLRRTMNLETDGKVHQVLEFGDKLASLGRINVTVSPAETHGVFRVEGDADGQPFKPFELHRADETKQANSVLGFVVVGDGAKAVDGRDLPQAIEDAAMRDAIEGFVQRHVGALTQKRFEMDPCALIATGAAEVGAAAIAYGAGAATGATGVGGALLAGAGATAGAGAIAVVGAAAAAGYALCALLG